MRDEMELWEAKEGVAFLRRIGIRSGQRVLDFGARVGHYTIPAAKIVGQKGLVYAVDKDKYALNDLQQKAMDQSLENIRVEATLGEFRLQIKDESIDFALLYDVLHFFNRDQRKNLYQEVHRVLKVEGVLSIYPKHLAEDDPLYELKDHTAGEIAHEVKASGFSLDEKYCAKISHDNQLIEGCVLNFRREN